MEGHASGGSGRLGGEVGKLSLLNKRPKQKTPTVLRPLWLRAGRGRRAKSGKVLSESGEKDIFKVPLLFLRR